LIETKKDLAGDIITTGAVNWQSNTNSLWRYTLI
jgi:hypothetical protein